MMGFETFRRRYLRILFPKKLLPFQINIWRNSQYEISFKHLTFWNAILDFFDRGNVLPFIFAQKGPKTWFIVVFY